MKQSRHTHICSHSLSPPLRCNTPTHESLSSSHRKHLLPRCPDVASPSLLFFSFSCPVSLSRSLALLPSLSLLPAVFLSQSSSGAYLSCSLYLPLLFLLSYFFLLQCIFELPSFISPQFHDLFLFPFCRSKSNKIRWHEKTVLITEKTDCKALEILSKIRNGSHWVLK